MIGENAQAILARRSQQAEANRQAMPQTAAKLDEVRQTFPQARVTFAEENGRTVGKPLPDGVVPVLYRNTDPDTSKAAAERATAFVANHEAKIFGALHDAGFLGMTAKEIAEQTGLSDVQVGRRTAGMSTEQRKLIKRNGATRDGCAVWVIA